MSIGRACRRVLGLPVETERVRGVSLCATGGESRACRRCSIRLRLDRQRERDSEERDVRLGEGEVVCLDASQKRPPPLQKS